MSYQDKYLKYKSKYLELKKLADTMQTGGSKNKNLNDVTKLTETPSKVDVFGYEFGTNFSKPKQTGGLNMSDLTNFRNLVNLIEKNEEPVLTETDINLSDVYATEMTGGSEQDPDANNTNNTAAVTVTDLPAALSETPAGTESSVPATESSVESEKLEKSSESPISPVESTTTTEIKPVENQQSETSVQQSENQGVSSLYGGAKKHNKNTKKHFFEDSDLDSSDSESSILSELDSDSSDDYDL